MYGLIMLVIFSVAFLTTNMADLRVPLIGCSWPVLALPIAYMLIIRREHKQLGAENDEEHLPSESALANLPTTHFYGVLGLLCACIIGGGILTLYSRRTHGRSRRNRADSDWKPA